MSNEIQNKNVFDAFESAGHSYYGEELPDDFVWDLLPVLYIRLYSYTSWRRIKNASLKAKDEESGRSLMREIDQMLVILSRQFDGAAVLQSMGYGTTGITWQYVKELIEIVTPITSDKGVFFETYSRFFQPLNEQMPLPRLTKEDYSFACDLAKTAGLVKTNEFIFCPNFGWPEFIEQARLHLHCKGLVGREMEYQNAYFASLYAHTKGWVCAFEGGSLLADEENEGNRRTQRKRRCAIGVIPNNSRDKWVEATLNDLRDDGMAFLISPNEGCCPPEKVEYGALGVFFLKDCSISIYATKQNDSKEKFVFYLSDEMNEMNKRDALSAFRSYLKTTSNRL